MANGTQFSISTRRIYKAVILLTLILTLFPACSGNSFLISTVYNRADNSIAKNFYRYADFDQQQRATIKASVEQYHLWHRKTQLPEYLILIKQIRNAVASSETLATAKLDNWFDDSLKLRRKLIQCSPIMYASPLLQQLNEGQIKDIDNRFLELAEKSKKRRAKRSAQKKEGDREKQLYKNFKRVGLKLNAAQIEMIIATSNENTSLRNEWQLFWSEWKQEFLSLLGQRQETGFPLKLQQHLNQFWYMGELHHPEVIKENRARWISLTSDISESLSQDQKNEFVSFLDNLIASLEKLTTKTPTPDLALALAVPDECRYVNNPG